MASFECENCGVRYPHSVKYQDCPVCDDRCRRVKDDPTISRAEAEQRLRMQETYTAFEEWCKENGRRPEDVRPCYIEMPADAVEEDTKTAMAVAWMIEDAYPTYCVGALYVFDC